MSKRPPFIIPPEQLSLWDKEDNEVYTKWKSKEPIDYKGWTSKTAYRQYVIDTNTKFNMEEVFDQIEIGLTAFEKLIQCTKAFPSYNLEEDLDLMYKSVEHGITKEFIRKGVEFVRNFQPVGLSQSDSCDAAEQILTTPVDKGKEAMKDLKMNRTGEKKKKKKKRSKQKRLLTFQENLVNVLGLPPSRLMRGLVNEFEQIGGAEASSIKPEQQG